jgi:hypothetical protein
LNKFENLRRQSPAFLSTQSSCLYIYTCSSVFSFNHVALSQFESRKIHATRRVRGSDGRFVPKDIADAARRQVESALAASAAESTTGVGGAGIGVGGVASGLVGYSSGSAFHAFPYPAGAGHPASFAFGSTSAAGMTAPFGHFAGIGGGSSGIAGTSASSSSSATSIGRGASAANSGGGDLDGGDVLLTLRHPQQLQQPRQHSLQSPQLPPQSMQNALHMLQGAASHSSGSRALNGGAVGSSSSSNISGGSVAAPATLQAFAAAILHRE